MKQSSPSPKAPEGADRHTQALARVAEVKALYPEARSLMDEERSRSLGRLVYRDATLYAQLFDTIDGSSIRAAFDALGAHDQGDDPSRFETDVLRARLQQVAGLSSVSKSLRELADLLDDEALQVGADTAVPALMALELARVLARNNAEFRGKIAPVLNALGAMTAAARQALAANRAAESAAAETPKPTAE